jgi:hypothetical protein
MTRYLILALALLGGFFLAFWPGPSPDITIVPSRPGVGRAGTRVLVRVKEGARGITRIRVEALQGGAAVPLGERVFPSSFPPLLKKGEVETEVPVEVGPQTVPGLAEGQLTLRVEALGTGAWLRSPRAAIEELPLPVRLTPPQLTVTSHQNYAAQGGSGIVVYRVGASVLEEGGLDGVEAGGSFFPGLPVPGGGGSERFALYGVPYDLTSADGIELVAEDPLGNRTAVPFVERYFARPLKKDTILLTVDFMTKVVPEILAQTPERGDRGDLLANYLAINRELRVQNAEALRELGGAPARASSGAVVSIRSPGAKRPPRSRTAASTFSTVATWTSKTISVSIWPPSAAPRSRRRIGEWSSSRAISESTATP